MRLGKDLVRLQMGERIAMPVSRPMPVVGGGVSELRVKGADGIFRVFYYLCLLYTSIHSYGANGQPPRLKKLLLAAKRILVEQDHPAFRRTPGTAYSAACSRKLSRAST